MHGDPILFFDKLHPLLVLCILSKNKNYLNERSFNFIAISTQIRSNYCTNTGICDFPSVRVILPEETILQAKM